jgi:hypothetical protein
MAWEDRIRLVRDEIRERTNGETLDSSIKFFIYRGLEGRQPMSTIGTIIDGFRPIVVR